MDAVTYALCKGYVRKTADALGAVKGAPATIESIIHQDGVNRVTFKWTGDSGAVETRVMEVYDGTPIYVWEAGNTYKYGDLAIYESAFYRCIIANSDSTFDDTKWNEIGSPDGNYDIVRNKDYLPVRFTATDRKMYFAYEENCFYFWNGTTWGQKFKVDDEINDTSTNPVQNKVIYDALDKKQDKLTAGLGVTIEYNSETHLTTIDVNNISAEELEDMWRTTGILNLSTDTVAVAVDEAADVDVTSTGTIVLLVGDTDIATAAYANGKITITGVATGATEVTVISSANEDYKAVTATIAVTVS